ncbi:hypothetical protein MTO96_045709, partial [Rhipicephalus appendiculatus]
QRRDIPGYQCFSGKIIRSGDEAYIKEAGESCTRGEDPLLYGMKIAKQASCNTVLPPRPPPVPRALDTPAEDRGSPAGTSAAPQHPRPVLVPGRDPTPQHKDLEGCHWPSADERDPRQQRGHFRRKSRRDGRVLDGDHRVSGRLSRGPVNPKLSGPPFAQSARCTPPHKLQEMAYSVLVPTCDNDQTYRVATTTLRATGFAAVRNGSIGQLLET